VVQVCGAGAHRWLTSRTIFVRCMAQSYHLNWVKFSQESGWGGDLVFPKGGAPDADARELRCPLDAGCQDARLALCALRTGSG
jgi:hypothetical protein